MSEHPTAYQCLPMVVANQWGWQVLCPTDVRVIWNGGASQSGLRVEVDPQWAPGDQEPVRPGDRHVLPPLGLPDPARLGPLRQRPEQPLEGQRPPPRRDHRDLVAQLHVHAQLETDRARRGPLRQRREPRPALPVPHATFQGASAIEAPINEAEPKAAADLLRWLEERRKIATDPVPTHRRYLKAEDIEGHLTKVPVPPVVRTWGPKDEATGETSPFIPSSEI